MNQMSENQTWKDPSRAQEYTSSTLPYCVSEILRPQLTKIVFPHVFHNLRHKKRALDAGCGDAFYANELRRVFGEVVAIDNSPEMLFLAKCSYGTSEGMIIEERDVATFDGFQDWSFSPFNLQDPFDPWIEFDEKKKDCYCFNFILANMLIPNLSESQLKKFLAKSRRNLTPDGRLLITNVADESFQHHSSPWLKHEFEGEIDTHGGRVMVSLGRDGSTLIGPFPNYLWSTQVVEKFALQAGLERETTLLLHANCQSYKTPLYQAQIYKPI